MEIEDDAETARLEPAAKAVEQVEDFLAVDAGALLEHALVEADADMVEAHRRDVLRVRLREVRAEVLEVADREARPPRLRQDVEALVVREPAAEAHAAAEFGKRFALHARTFYPNAQPVATVGRFKVLAAHATVWQTPPHAQCIGRDAPALARNRICYVFVTFLPPAFLVEWAAKRASRP